MNEHDEKAPPILVIDDETNVLTLFSSMLKANGIGPVFALDDSRQVLPFLAQHDAALVLTDLTMPFLSGQELLLKIKLDFPHVPVIVLTAVADIEIAVDCMKNGASDYLVKPVERARLVSSVQKVLEIKALQNQVSTLKRSLLSGELQDAAAFAEIVSASAKMHAIFQYVEAIADSPFPVLIAGETGVGKELIARAVHRCRRQAKEFVAINVAGLDDNMFSDTLFGHRKGAFTGAEAQREGLVAQAAGGTLFLDEICDLSPQSQIKLLRLIQEREYYPLGMDTVKKTDARVICTANRDLKPLVQKGEFRKDLYYRLAGHRIDIPPLRERREDIPGLVLHFLDEGARKMGKKKPTPPPELMHWLSTYDFPGNVRELQAMIFNAISQHRSGVLSMESFKKTIAEYHEESEPAPAGEAALKKNGTEFLAASPTLKQAEDFLIAQALSRAGGNQGLAASMLGITRQALNRRLSRRKK